MHVSTIGKLASMHYSRVFSHLDSHVNDLTSWNAGMQLQCFHVFKQV